MLMQLNWGNRYGRVFVLALQAAKLEELEGTDGAVPVGPDRRAARAGYPAHISVQKRHFFPTQLGPTSIGE
jgi:hypothetical protein